MAATKSYKGPGVCATLGRHRNGSLVLRTETRYRRSIYQFDRPSDLAHFAAWLTDETAAFMALASQEGGRRP